MRKRVILLISFILIIAVGAGYIFGVYLPRQREEAEREKIVREYYESKYYIYKEENMRYADYEVDVAFLGDSLTDGYPLSEYYPHLTVVNRGIGGETTHGLLERMKLSAYDLKPKAVVLLIGGNNLNSMLEDYEQILSGLTENLPETKVVVCSLTAMGGSFKEKNKIAAYNNVVIKMLADQYGCYYVDLFTPLLNAETGEIFEDFTSDGAHLTPLGYDALTKAITPTLEKALAIEE